MEIIENEEILFIVVEQAKNDKERIGHTILLGKEIGSALCPVSWYHIYKKVRNINSAFLKTLYAYG